MAKIDREQERLAAARYAQARKQQESTSVEAEARMLNRRMDFLAPGDSLFLESIVEDSDLMPLRYFAQGQMAAAAVGRILVRVPDGKGTGFATGFLVAPGLLLTNWHVLRTADWARGATLTMDAEDGIDGLPKTPRIFRLEPDRLFLSDNKFDLDYAFVAVASRAVDGTLLSRYGHLRLFGESGKIVRGEYATIIQHPNGRQKHLAARNNRITVYSYDDDLTNDEKAENNFIYYSADTLKGSSGSPVFSDQWFVVALHRRGVPETTEIDGRLVVLRTNKQPAADDDPDEVISYVSNEGVRVSRMLRRLEALVQEGTPETQATAQRLLTAIAQAAGSPEDGPFATPAARIAILEERKGGRREPVQTNEHEPFELTRRRIDLFPNRLGYSERFLSGHVIPLPTPSATLRQELAPRLDKPDEYVLPFRHFSTAMHARRRLPIFAAVNIDRKNAPDGAMPNRPEWSIDPRIDEAHQPDDTIFSDMLHRGHMAAREYIYWGGDADEIKQADLHSFTLTNVCPQIRRFNATVEWYKIERQVAGGSEQERIRITEFVGPILRSTDPSYDDLRGGRSTANLGSNIRIPLRFWKIICWVENGDLKHEALILDQRDELEAAGPLEFSLSVPVGVTQTTVREIENLTDLRFGGLG